MNVQAGDRFPNLEELELEHVKLLEDLDRASAGETVVSDSESERKFVAANRERIFSFLARGAMTGTLLHGLQERRPAQQILDRWSACLFRVGIKDAPAATLASFDESAAPDLRDTPCPYVGLEPFREGEARRFFGRNERTADLVDAVRTRTLVFVTGASGSGKSSLVLAGLLPALEQGAIPGSDRWAIVPAIVPGSNPLRNLVHQLCATFAAIDAEALYETLRTQPQRLRAVLDENAPTTCLLVIDQFEEVFALKSTDAAGDSSAFVAALVALALSEQCPHRIVATFRKDREGDLAASAELQHMYFDRPFIVTSMLPEQLRAAIESPAAQAGLIIEPDVVEALVNTFTGDETGLPLLQYCLVELWQRRTRNRVTRKTLAELGDPKHAMAKVADEIYGALTVQGQAAVKLIFLQLSRKVEGQEFLRTRKTRKELWSVVGNKLTADDVLRRFAERRLLKIAPAESPDPADDTIEVAHEALLRNWNEFRKWVVEEGSRIDQRMFVSRQAALWAESAARQGAPKEQDATGLLLSGIALRQAMADIYAEFPDGSVERRFLDASQKKATWIEAELQRAADAAKKEAAWAKEGEQRKARSYHIALAVIAVIVALALGLVVLASSVSEQRNELLAQRVGASARLVCETDPTLARRLARRTFEIDHRERWLAHLTFESGERDRASAVRDAVAASFCLIRSPSTRFSTTSLPNSNAVSAFALGPNGRVLITGDASGTVEEWTIGEDSVQRVATWVSEVESRQASGKQIRISALAYSPDMNHVAVGKGWLGTEGAESGGGYCEPGESCGALALLSRAPVPPTADAEGAGPDHVVASLKTGPVSHVAFSRDGTHLAVVSLAATDGTPPSGNAHVAAVLQIWDRAEIIERRSFARPKYRTTIDGGIARLATGSGPKAFVAVMRTNRALAIQPAGSTYSFTRLRVPECDSPTSVSAGDTRQVFAQSSKVCLYASPGDQPPLVIEQGNVLFATLRRGDDLLITLSAAQEQSADLVIRNLKRGDDTVVLRKVFDLSDMNKCAERSSPAARAACGDFDARIQASSDGKTIAVKSTSETNIDVYRVTPPSAQFAWLRQPTANIVFSADDRIFGVLEAGDPSRPRRTVEYRAYEALTGHEVQRAVVDFTDRGVPTLAMIDGDGGRFAIQDASGFTVWRAGGELQSPELAVDFESTVYMYPTAGAFGVVRRNETGMGTSCALYLLGAPSRPVWTTTEPFAACQFSDDARVAVVETGEGSARTVSVMGTGTPGTSDRVAGLSVDAQYFLAGAKAKYLFVAVPVPGATRQSQVTAYAWREGKLVKTSEYVGPAPADNIDSSRVFAVDDERRTFLVVEGDDRVSLRSIEHARVLRILTARAIDASGRHTVASSGSKMSIARAGEPGISIEAEPGSRIEFASDARLALITHGNRSVIHDLAAQAPLADVPFPVQESRFSTAGSVLVVRTADGAYLLPLRIDWIDGLIALGEPPVQLRDAESCNYENDKDACDKVRKQLADGPAKQP